MEPGLALAIECSWGGGKHHVLFSITRERWLEARARSGVPCVLEAKIDVRDLLLLSFIYFIHVVSNRCMNRQKSRVNTQRFPFAVHDSLVCARSLMVELMRNGKSNAVRRDDSECWLLMRHANKSVGNAQSAHG